MPHTLTIAQPSSDPIINIALDTLKKGKQLIVFCNTKRGAESQAEKIATKVKTDNPEYLDLSEKALKTLPSSTKQCKRLALCLKKGIAFHHAGLHNKQRDLIETKFREGVVKIICATPTLCLSGDTRVWQGTSETEVAKLNTSRTIFALSGNQLKNIKPKRIEELKNRSSLIQIRSGSGYRIKVTPNHKLLVKRKGRRMLLRAVHLKKDDRIATVGRVRLKKCSTPRISDFVLDNELGTSNRRFDSSLSYFIGLMLGDGYSGAETREKILYKGSPCIVGIDKEIFGAVRKVCKNVNIPSRSSRNYHGTPQLVLGKHKWFREFLVRCGVEVRDRKHISQKLMVMPLEETAALLRGLFDTDGYVQKGHCVGFTNISERLVRQMQRLLLRFGIVSRIRRKKEGIMKIYEKEYPTQPSFELSILQKRSILDYFRLIGFGIGRKEDVLFELVVKIASNLHYVSCERCSYKVYRYLFGGRSAQQKAWGKTKQCVIRALGRKGELGSRELCALLGREPKKNETRLNHHYQLIQKRRVGTRSKTEWFWSLNAIGGWIYTNILAKEKKIEEFFSQRECPLCRQELSWYIKKGWRDKDFEGDIFWDIVREIKRVPPEETVYDLLLPQKPPNDHLFVAEGFIVHNSMGLDLPAFRVIIRDLKRFNSSGGWGMTDIPVLEYHQMAGRAGRPGKEEYGEAIILAETKDQKEARAEKYIYGAPEEIYSKLAVEPVLRTYVLSLIASEFVTSVESLYEFFDETFYAKQYGDLEKLHSMLDAMIDRLSDWEFLKAAGSADDFVSANEVKTGKLEATLLGKRVAELYLDPYTAHFLMTCLKRATEKGMHDFAIVHMLSSCLEMRPWLRPKVREVEEIIEKTMQYQSELLAPEPNQFSAEYEEYLMTLKTALFFQEWIDEVGEDKLMERLGIAPGEVHGKLERADWLIYATEELARIMNYQPFRTPLAKMRLRLKHGAKAELLPLLKLKKIGRVRARKLFNARIRSVEDVKKAEFSTLAALIGKAIALDIKKQVGQDLEPGKVQVKPNKRKGQKSIVDF